MTTASYRVLLSVVMRHAYFTDGRLCQLAAQPTPATAERLRRMGLLLKTLPDGFLVLASQPGVRPLVEEPLLFSLRVLDPYFVNYSDLPLLAGLAHTYCLGPPVADPPALRLHTGPVVGAADQLLLQPLQFQQVVVPAAGTTAVLSRYPAGPVLWQQPVPAQATRVAIDVRLWGSGRYQLQVGEETVLFYADDYLAAQRPWGLLAFDAAVLTTATPLAYTLSFAARPTYWQYQLVARRAPLPTALAVEGDATINFTEVLPTSGATTCFRASQSIALAQRYSRPPLQLTAAVGPRRQVLWPVLPQASPQALKPEQSNNTTLFLSDIFVSL